MNALEQLAGAPVTRPRLSRNQRLAYAVLAVSFLATPVMALSDDSSPVPVADPAVGVEAPVAAPPDTADTVGPVAGLRPLPRPVEVAAEPTPGAAAPADVGANVSTGGFAPPTVPAPESAPEVPPPPAGCPQLGLPAPERTGGMASLIAVVPLFGSFAPEAFAFLPVFEPLLEVFGPMLPEAERALTELQPALDLVVPGAQQLGDAGFETLAPLYEPYRSDVLSAESDLAAALVPVVEAIATAPGTECVVALEGVVAEVLAGRP